ncbi:MAG: lysylphosphatidylglycerol synthase transmembrane domain-containing protein [Thermodesulfobacteriota bacterium]
MALPRRGKSGLRLAAKAVVSAGLLALLLRGVPLGSMAEQFGRLDPLLLVAAAALLVGRTFLSAWRWQLLLRGRGVARGICPLTRLYFVGMFLNNFLPTSLGGDMARVSGLALSGAPLAVAASSVVVERALGFAALFGFIAVSLGSGVAEGLERLPGKLLAGLLVGALLLGVFAWCAVRFRKSRAAGGENLVGWLLRVVGEIGGYVDDLPRFWGAALLSVFFQFLGVAGVWLACRPLAPDAGLLDFLLLVPVSFLAGMLPVSLNGLGVREGVFVAVGGLLGFTRDAATTCALVWLGLYYLQSAIGAVALIPGSNAEKGQG